MAEAENSAVLKSLFEYAKNFSSSEHGPLLIEHFMLAVLDLIEEKTPFNDELIRVALKSMLENAGMDLTRARSILSDAARRTDPSYIQITYMPKTIAKAKAAALEAHCEELRPEMLMEHILKAPCYAVRRCLPDDDNYIYTVDEPESIKLPFEVPSAKEASAEKIPIWEGPLAEDRKAEMAELVRKVKEIQNALSKRIFGQDNAISVFTSGYFQAKILAMANKERRKPAATFLFAGPPGVGKTFLAEQAAELLGMDFMRFDMSEYADKEANIEFCGSDKVYKNGKPGNVTGFVAAHPKSILLFDEVEKAHPVAINLFLQLLDAGRLRDNYTDKEVSFRDTIVILTTNAGKQLYEESESGDFSNLSRKVILKALEKDVNPTTGKPFFPAAICSRLASGHVVMFNHIATHDLLEIAKRETLRHAEQIEKACDLSVEIDERVYTALLFAEGGQPDARMVTSRAGTFFNEELFELLRLIDSDKVSQDVTALQKIKIEVELPEQSPEILSLFENGDVPNILVFGSPETAGLCGKKAESCRFFPAQGIEEADNLLRTTDIGLVLIDLTYGLEDVLPYLNIEDIDSEARDFFWHIREKHADLPIYLLQPPTLSMNPEEKVSFLRQGARGILPITPEEDGFEESLLLICKHLHQQQSVHTLARANKVVSFETAQTLSPDGTCAAIKLFDFEMTVAVDAEDSENILSGVSRPNVRFEEVIGAEDAKRELQYFVQYLKNPKKYLGTGVSAPKGVLLYGPPGTGKTMLAKAMASASDVTFIAAEGNQFLKGTPGEGPKKVHELFRTARKYAPSILFVDEIDSIAQERRGGGNPYEATLTAFLTEMDGFKNDAAKPVFVLAATNFDVEPGGNKSLDPALMRRFDRRVYIDLPDREERTRYMKERFAENPAFELSKAKIENIAIRSTGMSIAELESVIELSLRSAIRDGGLKVTDEIFDEAFETFNDGEVNAWDASTLERVARHEAGHAFLYWLNGETPSYLTVVARGDHGGYMQQDDNEGKHLYTKAELLSRIRTSLGGRAAEMVYYGEEDGLSSGASGDLANATNIAYHMVCDLGMDKSIGIAVLDEDALRTGEMAGPVRDAVNRILLSELENAMKLLSDSKPRLDALVKRLISKGHLSGAEIARILKKSK